MAASVIRVDVPERNGRREKAGAAVAGGVIGAVAVVVAPPFEVPEAVPGGAGGWSPAVVLVAALFGAFVLAAALAYPFHEAVHAVVFRLCGVPRDGIEWHLTSCNAPGARLTRARYAGALAAPYPVLLLAAWALCRHGVLLVPGALLLAVLPLTSIKDTKRLAGVLRAPAGLLWEDVPGAALGWSDPQRLHPRREAVSADGWRSE